MARLEEEGSVITDSSGQASTRRSRREVSERARLFRERMIPPDSFRVVDVAYILGVDPSSVLRYIRAGTLFATNVGREYLVAEQDLQNYIEGQQARRREKQRAARIRREVMEVYNRVKNTPAAEDLTLATCRHCGHETILQLDRKVRDDGFNVRWTGPCQFCGEYQDIAFMGSPSIADREGTTSPHSEDEESSWGDSTDDSLFYSGEGDDSPF
jgi:excisionase family DNA binding protein